MFSVQVDLTQYRALVGQTEAMLLHACEDTANEGATLGAMHAVTNPNFRNRTGRLLSSINPDRATPWGTRGYMARYSATTPYAAHVEYGTRPHPIVAKASRGFVGPLEEGQSRAKGRSRGVLIFYWEREGFWFVGKRVQHPGTEGRLYMSRAARHAYYSMLRAFPRHALRVGSIWN